MRTSMRFARPLFGLAIWILSANPSNAQTFQASPSKDVDAGQAG